MAYNCHSGISVILCLKSHSRYYGLIPHDWHSKKAIFLSTSAILRMKRFTPNSLTLKQFVRPCKDKTLSGAFTPRSLGRLNDRYGEF
jgi:hypothetical protein